MSAIRRLKNHRVKIDVIALRKELLAGTLTAADRKTAEAILGGPLEKIFPTITKAERAS